MTSALACRFDALHSDRDSGQGRMTCVWCDGPLPTGRPAWCSDDCVRLYVQNHQWGNARRVAILRDARRCRRCGRGPGAFRIAAALISLVDPTSAVEAEDVAFWAYRSMPHEYRLNRETRLEVNHVEPRKGRGYGPGCAHHQENLETLCEPCHREVTVAQRRGWIGPGSALPLRVTV